jgi:hypothetical protein
VIETTAPHRDPAREFWRRLAAAVVVSGCVYVGLRWSPSSYAIILQQLGVSDTGVIAGVPRGERGDEFAWQTPLLQMTLRSGFQRFDRTPPYFEDLRTLYGMPIADWALIFKPQFWLFFVAPAATAYSFYHFLLIAMFVVGYTVLFVRLGGRRIDSLLMALVLFFSSYIQYWWDGAANFFNPFFPWIVLAPLLAIPFAARLALFFWLLVSALLSYFYPPNAISLGFVAVVMWLVVWPDWLQWRKTAALALTAAAAGATVLFYLRDALAVVGQTVYPGQRISGGGGVYFRWWLTQLLPTSHMNHHVALIPGPNICELSTIGSVYVLAALFFVPWRQLWRESSREDWRRWLILGAGLFATQAWMTISLPPWVGYPLLWHLVQPGRMVLAGGVMLITCAFLLGQRFPLRVSGAGCVAFTLTLVLGWALFKRDLGIGLAEAYRDWLFAVPVAAAAGLLGLGWLTPARANTLLLAAAVTLGVLSFGRFNPIQSTTPIFATHQTPVTADLDRRLRQEGRGFLLLPWGTHWFAQTGMPLIALGYPSLAYSTFDPAMDLWKRIYTDVPADELNHAFNNVGTFGFGDVPRPVWQPIYTIGPMAPFLKPGLTVCDLIRPSRTALAASVGCREQTAAAAALPRGSAAAARE